MNPFDVALASVLICTLLSIFVATVILSKTTKRLYKELNQYAYEMALSTIDDSRRKAEINALSEVINEWRIIPSVISNTSDRGLIMYESTFITLRNALTTFQLHAIYADPQFMYVMERWIEHIREDRNNHWRLVDKESQASVYDIPNSISNISRKVDRLSLLLVDYGRAQSDDRLHVVHDMKGLLTGSSEQRMSHGQSDAHLWSPSNPDPMRLWGNHFPHPALG